MTLATLADLLFDVTIRSTLLLLLAFAVTSLLQRSSAAVRHLVWAAALTGAIVLPVLSAVLPPLRLAIPAQVASMSGQLFDIVMRAGGEQAADAGRTGAPGAVASAGGWLLQAAILLWFAGMALVASRLLLGLLATWRLGRQSAMVIDGGWLHLAHDIAHRLGATRGVTLLRGRELNVPMTWGVLRPVIWLPGDAETWTEERRRVVLAHELAHVRRADAFTQWVGHIATVVFWFNPLVWIAVARLHEERERACDDAVLRLGTPSISYADHLLDVARAVGRRPAASAAMAMARHSPFEGRMRAILDRSAARDSVASRRGLAIASLALAFIVPMAALQPEGQAQVAGAREGASGSEAAGALFGEVPASSPVTPAPALEGEISRETEARQPRPSGVASAPTSNVQQPRSGAAQNTNGPVQRAETAEVNTPSGTGSRSASSSSSSNGSASSSQSSSSSSDGSRADR